MKPNLLLQCCFLAAVFTLQPVKSQYSGGHELRGRANELEEEIAEDDSNISQNHRRLGCFPRGFPTFPPSVDPETVVSFVAMGDSPYNTRDRFCLNHQLRNLDLKNGPKFAIHVGDITGSKREVPCNRRLYKEVATMFAHPRNALKYSPKDLFFVVGDNEWTDCYKQDKAWQHYMALFGPGNRYGFGELSAGNVTVERQLDEERLPGVKREENFAFFMNNVLFIGLNIVGGRDQGDESVRLVQNFEWTRDKLEYYSNRGMNAVVIFAHAYLMNGPRKTYYADSLFALLREKYVDLRVMYLHGDGHEYCVRYPDKENRNFVTVMVDQGGYADPILVSVLRNPYSNRHTFAVDRQGGLYNPDGASEDITECPIIEEDTWSASTSPPPAPAPGDQKELTWIGGGRSELPYEGYLLGRCEGDCDKDQDCQAGLQCFLRRRSESVPGCAGTGRPRKDYCYDPLYNSRNPRLNYRYINPPYTSFKYGVCEGDCDNDGQCEDGLKCLQRNNAESVPACAGDDAVNGVDYCVPDV